MESTAKRKGRPVNEVRLRQIKELTAIGLPRLEVARQLGCPLSQIRGYCDYHGIPKNPTDRRIGRPRGYRGPLDRRRYRYIVRLRAAGYSIYWIAAQLKQSPQSVHGYCKLHRIPKGRSRPLPGAAPPSEED